MPPPGISVQPADPSCLWIRYAPRSWPGPEGLWTDLARGGLGDGDPRALAEIPAAGDGKPVPLDDLLYLPPTAADQTERRDRTARRLLAQGTPVLVQLAPGDPPPPAGATVVYDLLPALLAGDLAALERLPAGAAAFWPLIPGLTSDPAGWEAGCERLATAGVATLQALTPALPPPARRRLAAGCGEEVFHALFHRRPPPERDLARVAHRHGLAPFLARPLPAPPLSGRGNRELAGLLLLGAELWLRLERPVGRALALIRAAHWIDGASYDVAALTRDGNLGVVGEIDAACRPWIEAWVEGGRLSALDELLAEYVSG